MKRHNLHTTISKKHWELLKKYQEKYGTQQKVLEFALDNLENNPKQSPPLSKEKELWLRLYEEAKDVLLIFQKNSAKLLFETADTERFKEYIANQRPIEFVLEYYYRKPLKECTLQELIDGIILNTSIQGTGDVISYTDDGDYYTIKINHSLGINFAKMTVMMHESLFKSYGVRFESHFSERSIFFKIYKTAR